MPGAPRKAPVCQIKREGFSLSSGRIMEIVEFKEIILLHYQQAGRKFPWHFADPWGVMVSEFMLQQTRAERVIPYWENWMKAWPPQRPLHQAKPLQRLFQASQGQSDQGAGITGPVQRGGTKTSKQPGRAKTIRGPGKTEKRIIRRRGGGGVQDQGMKKTIKYYFSPCYYVVLFSPLHAIFTL